ncbi:hypothetical protein SRABI26_04628 [Arthrobacter sp. Bi26]|nr:hypothetical protein SRABI26_04628 [Arthrobacter sp. Bi26]
MEGALNQRNPVAVRVGDRSADGRRVIAAFQESGKSRFTYPFNEFMYVLRGSITCTLEGGQKHYFTTGDSAFFPEGTTADLDISDDFMDLTFLTSEHEIQY